jgi:hypothetical protein
MLMGLVGGQGICQCWYDFCRFGQLCLPWALLWMLEMWPLSCEMVPLPPMKYTDLYFWPLSWFQGVPQVTNWSGRGAMSTGTIASGKGLRTRRSHSLLSARGHGFGSILKISFLLSIRGLSDHTDPLLLL